MRQDPNKKISDSQDVATNTRRPISKHEKKKDTLCFETFSDILTAINNIDFEKPKAFDESVSLFEAVRISKDISNQQLEDYFSLLESKLDVLWISFLTKVSVNLCNNKKINDLKLIPVIRMKAKEILSKYGIGETGLTSAEKNICELGEIRYITEFLVEAQKQNSKNEQQISNADLACLSFICFSLYRRGYNDSIATQLLIDRAIAEYFTSPELSGVKEKDLAGKAIGGILSGRGYSPKKLAYLTYLYSGTSSQLIAQAERIKNLEETRKSQLARIDRLSVQISSLNDQNNELQEQVKTLSAQVEAITKERNDAENLLAFEKNKFEKQLESQEAGVADQLSSDIGLELLALRDLVEHLAEDEQKRFRRRLDRIDRYLSEFGGE